MPDATARFLRATRPQLVAIGGPQAVAAEVLTAAEQAAAPPTPPAEPATTEELDAATIYRQARARVYAATGVRLTVTGLTCGGKPAQATIEGLLAPDSLYAPPQRTRIILDDAGTYEIISVNDPQRNPWVYLYPPSGGWYGPLPAYPPVDNRPPPEGTTGVVPSIPTLQTIVDALFSEVGLAGSALVSAETVTGGVRLSALNGLTLTVGADGLPVSATSVGGTLVFSDWSNVEAVLPPQTAVQTPPPFLPPPCGFPLP